MNWGTKLVIGMAAFMLFIVAMAFYMFSKQGNDALVEEDYYERSIHYDQDIRAKQQMLDDRVEPLIRISESQLIIQLKDSANYELKLLRPSSAKEDKTEKGSTVGDSNLILVDRTAMHKGLWLLELRWKSKGRDYLYQKNITL